VDTGATSEQGVAISTVGWIAIGVAAWLVVALVVGVLIGRMIRRRDAQTPRGAETSETPETPGVPAPSPDSVGRRRRD